MEIHGILLDIEGTTTPIQFVHDVLFSYIRQHLEEYLFTNSRNKEVQEILRALKHEHDDDIRTNSPAPGWTAEPVAYLNWLMDEDRKSTALKALQGKIWYDGYRDGKLRGQVFPDVPAALQRWKQQRLDVRIFSSGSELSQRLLFGSTAYGDLTPFLNGYFDTKVGPKIDPGSYRTIAGAFQLPPEKIVFVSDVTKELDAARSSGTLTLLCRRPGNPMQVVHGHQPISSFDEIPC